MKLLTSLINHSNLIRRTFTRLIFTEKIVSYADLKVFWEFFFYLLAIFGATLIFVGKILIGLILFTISYLFFVKALRYEYSENKTSELNKAIQNQDIKYIKYLLKNGSNPNKLDGFGNSPLICLIKNAGNASTEMIDLLVKNGALLKNIEQRNPLDEAIRIFNNTEQTKQKNIKKSALYLKIIKQLVQAEGKSWLDDMQLVELLKVNNLYDKIIE